MTLGSDQQRTFISIVIAYDVQNIGLSASPFFKQKKTFQRLCFLLPVGHKAYFKHFYNNNWKKKIKEEETVPPQVGFFVWGSFFSEVSAWNSKDVADFGELVRPLMIRQF